MMFEREQLIRAQRASLDALCEDTNLLFAAIGDLIALGMSAKKSALKDSAAETAALLDARDAKELLTVARDVRHPRLGKAVTYGCVFYDLMAQTQARAWRLAEIRANGVKEMLVEARAPSGNPETPGTSAALEAAKSLMVLGQLSLDSLKSTAREVAAMTERSIAAVTVASARMADSR